LNTKEDILKNVVPGSQWGPFSLKYILLFSAEASNSYRFETTWGWV